MTERGAWVKEELLNRLTFKPGEEVSVKGGGFFSNVEPTLGHDRYAALIELSSFSLTEAPDAERALLEQKVIEEAKRVVSIVQPQYVGSIEYTLKTHLDALDAHILAKTAKPKRVPGWYWANFTGHKDGKGRCPIHYDGKTFAFFEFSHGFGDKAETEFDWVSDTPLDLKREERACSKGYFERKE